MNYIYSILFLFSTVLTLCSCKGRHLKELEFKKYSADGIADSNHLEKGNWKFYTVDNHTLCQDGEFTQGLRKGYWNYYFPKKDSIFWVPYVSNKSLIRTNIPVFLSPYYEDDGFIAFKQKDTAKLLLLKIGFAKSINFNPENYNILVKKEVESNSVKVNSNQYGIVKTTCNSLYYFNKFEGIDLKQKSYVLYTINTILDSDLVEITLRTSSDGLDIGETIFYSVVSNLFVKNRRFLDPYIDCNIIGNRVTKTNWSLSFGCNRPCCP